MTSHPNRNWKRRWTVDFPGHEARHESGFTVRFAPAPHGWVGQVVAGLENVHPRDYDRGLWEATTLFARAEGLTWSAEQYQAKLKRVEQLVTVDPEKGTMAGRELDYLAEAITAYERKHFPMKGNRA